MQLLQKKTGKKKNKHSIEDSQPSGILNKTRDSTDKNKGTQRLEKGKEKKNRPENTSVTNEPCNFLKTHSVVGWNTWGF